MANCWFLSKCLVIENNCVKAGRNKKAEARECPFSHVPSRKTDLRALSVCYQQVDFFSRFKDMNM